MSDTVSFGGESDWGRVRVRSYFVPCVLQVVFMIAFLEVILLCLPSPYLLWCCRAHCHIDEDGAQAMGTGDDVGWKE